MSSSWECNLCCFALPQRFVRPRPVLFALSPSLLSLSSFAISPTPPIIPSIRSRRMSFFSRKKNVSYIPSSTVSTLASLPFFFFSSSQPGEASPTARYTARTSLSRHRHVSLLLSLYPYPRLTAHIPVYHHSLQFSAIPPRTYQAPTTNHQLLFALRQTPHPPTRLLSMVSLQPNSCHRNINRLPPSHNHSPLRNNNSPGLSIHGLLVA
jgi:hypothetical protein